MSVILMQTYCFRFYFRSVSVIISSGMVETHTQVVLMNHLQDLRQREVRICENTVFILISLKTEIARSVKGPKLQGLRAGDAMAKPYFVLKMLVTW